MTAIKICGITRLDDATLTQLGGVADALGLAALVEVHTAQECDRAVACGARIIGVNNRNLRTLVVDLEASHTIANRIPSDVIAVSESGLRTLGELRTMTALGYHAFLIGERFMTDSDPAGAIHALTLLLP